jgi:type I restriction enzyme S subunit
MEPKLRINLYKDDWKLVKAKDIFETYNRKNRPDLQVLSANQDIRGMAPRSESGYNISHDRTNEITYKHVLPGQFVIHLRSFQGGFAHSSVEGITSPAYTVFQLKDKTNHYDLFWKFVFMSEKFIKSLELITYGIRDGRSISYSEFSNMFFYCPSYEEQKSISKQCVMLYDSIAKAEKELGLLKSIKAASLQALFPKESNTNPKVRFNGFSGEWKKVKLSSFAKRVTRKNTHLESTLALTIASAYGLVSQIDYFNNLVVGSNISNYYLLKKGEFAYNKSYSKGYPFGSVKRLDRYDQGILSTLYITFSIDDTISSDYLTHFFYTTLCHKEVS